jgi:hypothetical membrane protein
MIDRWRRWLLAAGIAGPVIFVVGFLVLGATRPGYDPARVFVSQLSLGPGGWLQVANFIVTGVLIVAFAVGLARLVPSGPAAIWGPRIVALVGLGFILAGVFVTDPALGYPPGTPPGLPSSPSPGASIHYVGAMLVFFGLPAAMFVFARRFSRAGRGVAAAVAVGSALAMLGFYFAALVSASGGPAIDGVAGLLQRASAVVGLAWLALLGPALAAMPIPAERAVPPPIVRARA